MRVLFCTGGATGSGHIVKGLSVASALRRSALEHRFRLLSVETPFAELARYDEPFPRNFEDQYHRVRVNSDYVPKENGADQLVRRLMG